jgi:nitrile hydratase subunit beta
VVVRPATLEAHSAGCDTAGMAYANDVGGMHGFGELPGGDRPMFESVWEAQTFVLNQAFVAAGAYTLDEFRAAMERIPPAEYYAMPYYERWLTALETLVGS